MVLWGAISSKSGNYSRKRNSQNSTWQWILCEFLLFTSKNLYLNVQKALRKREHQQVSMPKLFNTPYNNKTLRHFIWRRNSLFIEWGAHLSRKFQRHLIEWFNFRINYFDCMMNLSQNIKRVMFGKLCIWMKNSWMCFNFSRY